MRLSFQTFRRISQILFLLLFLFLFVQTESKGTDTLGYPVKLFLDFDPLLFISTVLSSRIVTVSLFVSLSLLVLTLLFGRAFCGWICPLGTLNQAAGLLRRPRRHQKSFGRRGLKYYLLFFLLAGSVFGLQLTGIFDPLSLLVRSFSLAVYPLFDHAVRWTFDSLYALNAPTVTGLSEPVYDLFKQTLLVFRQPFFYQAWFVGLLFLAVLALNLVERRFWCRYLCPLGALLGLVSRFSLLRRTAAGDCNECGACARSCQGAAAPEVRGKWKKEECLYCGNCLAECRRKAVSFEWKGEPAPPSPDLRRRSVVLSVFAALAAVPLSRVSSNASVPEGPGNPEPGTSLGTGLIRPPGSQDEQEFLRRCAKCGACMRVCITNGLQPALMESGLEGIWTPRLIPRIGYCEYRCTLCGQVCPTGAIPKLGIDEKIKAAIGLAVIDEDKCLPYAEGTPCIVCEEVCPVSPKAVLFEEVEVRDREGRMKRVKRPRVDRDRCNGCGICENKCPVEGRSAIIIKNLRTPVQAGGRSRFFEFARK